MNGQVGVAASCVLDQCKVTTVNIQRYAPFCFLSPVWDPDSDFHSRLACEIYLTVLSSTSLGLFTCSDGPLPVPLTYSFLDRWHICSRSLYSYTCLFQLYVLNQDKNIKKCHFYELTRQPHVT